MGGPDSVRLGPVMRASRGWARIARLVSLSGALVGAVISWDTVCLGQDGHVAFEPSLAGRCVAPDRDPGSEKPRAVALGRGVGPPCCGPCRDLLGASEQWLERSPAKSQDPGRPARAATCWPAWGLLPPYASRPLALATSAPLAPRTASSGTILRC